jgi:hypothetical protein
MNSIKALDARYELVAWGIILILVGCLSVIPGDQSAAGVRRRLFHSRAPDATADRATGIKVTEDGRLAPT